MVISTHTLTEKNNEKQSYNDFLKRQIERLNNKSDNLNQFELNFFKTTSQNSLF